MQLDRKIEARALVAYLELRHPQDKMRSKTFRAELAEPTVDRRTHPELHVCDWFDQLGSHVKLGLLVEAAFLDVSARTVSRAWELLVPTTELMRDEPIPASATTSSFWRHARTCGCSGTAAVIIPDNLTDCCQRP